MDAAWGHYIIDAVLAVLGLLGKRQLDRMDADRKEQNVRIENQRTRSDDIVEELSRISVNVDNHRTDLIRLDQRENDTNAKVDKHFDMIRESLHELRNTIGMKYVTREEFQVTTSGIADKIDKIPGMVTKDVRQMLTDMGIIGRRSND